MYRDYFGIEGNPFSNTPDPNFFYLSDRHQEALAHLQYGIHGSSGFVLLTGEVGTGKTTVCRYLLENLPENVDLALCTNPRLSEAELLATICDELRIDISRCIPDSVKDHMDALNNHLLVGYAKGRRAVLIIDEAQNLDYPLLEQVRLLTNLETASAKLLQIILIGQTELKDTLEQENMRQLNQRITARYHLEPMSKPEAEKYIRHRLQIGGLETDLMDLGALAEIFDRSGGVPRLINSICERSLLGAYAKEKKSIDRAIVRLAANEVLGNRPDLPISPEPSQQKTEPARVVFATLLAAAVVIGTFVLGSQDKVEIQKASASGPAAETPEADPPAEDPPPAWKEVDEGAKEKAVEKAGEKAGEQPEAAPPAVDDGVEAISRLIAEGAVTVPKPAAIETEVAANGNAAGTETASREDPALRDVTLQNLFRHPAIKGRLETAVARLFHFWNKKPTTLSGLNPCAEARVLGLWCYQRRGTLKRIKTINLPALISLVNGEGIRRYAVVSALTGPRVTLDIDDRKIDVDAAAFKLFWSGDFLVLWKPIPGLRINLRSGMEGDDVKWLRQRLTKILSLSSDAENPGLFDAGLIKLVTAFQKSHGLKGDGIVGVMTQIQLAAVIAQSDVPVLRNRP